MPSDDRSKEIRKGLYRALAGAPLAHPGVSGRKGMGQHSVGLGDPGPLVRGSVKIEVTEIATGKKTIVLEEDNLVVTQAADLMANMAAGLANSKIGYVELGDPSPATPPSLADTNLEQTTGQRKAVAPTVANNTATFVSVWAAGDGNGFTYTEAGLFTDPMPGGTMFARKTGFSIVKTAAFSMTFTWMLTFSVLDACQEACNGVALVGSSYTVEDYIYDATGGETQVVVPIDFVIGAKRLEVYLNGQRLMYTRDYTETSIGPLKGIQLTSISLNGPAIDVMYFRHLRW